MEKRRLLHMILGYDNTINEDLKVAWEAAEPIRNTKRIRYIGGSVPPVVIKKLESRKDSREYISFYCKIRCQQIRTPKIFSIDRENSMIKSQAVGIERDACGCWSSKTLVGFKYDPDKEKSVVDFLVRSLKYALKNRWFDLYTSNILFNDGYLYLIDYVPGSGNHKIGSFGLQKIPPDQKASLVKEGFDRLLEMALNKFPRKKVSYCGLDFLRSTDCSGAK